MIRGYPVDRHIGLYCGCFLIECCHNEDTDQGGRWRVSAADHDCRTGRGHHHSGNPATGFVHPWEPGDESWRDMDPITMLTGTGARNIRYSG